MRSLHELATAHLVLTLLEETGDKFDTLTVEDYDESKVSVNQFMY